MEFTNVNACSHRDDIRGLRGLLAGLVISGAMWASLYGAVQILF